MQKNIIKKGLVLAVIVLFISVCFQPIIAENTISAEKESNYNNVDFDEAKKYLFQTLIDISNNPEVKHFLNEHKHDLIKNNNNNYDCRNAIKKIYSHNPKLLKSILFTKPEMTSEYLEKNYGRGLEIVDILGEEESLKIVESVNITDSELLNELKNIILNDKYLSNRVTVLEKMNNGLQLEHPIICGIIFILFLPPYLFAQFSILIGFKLFYKFGLRLWLIIGIILWFAFIVNPPLAIISILYLLFNCKWLDNIP